MSTTESLTATEARVFVPERIFRMGTVDLPDPDAALEPERALRLYAQQWPHLRRARLAPPRMEGKRMIYEIEKPPVQTKG